MAEGINPSVENDYWREQYTSRSYAIPGASYDEYGPAYQYGWESRSRNTATNFEDVETALSQDWDRAKGKSTLKWDQAKPAARDAWERSDARSKIEEE